jgi:hypothetical protein
MVALILDYLYQWFSASSGDPSVRPVQWPFFKVNPNTLDSIFAVNADSTWETDQFLVNCHIGVKCVRPGWAGLRPRPMLRC